MSAELNYSGKTKRTSESHKKLGHFSNLAGITREGLKGYGETWKVRKKHNRKKDGILTSALNINDPLGKLRRVSWLNGNRSSRKTWEVKQKGRI